uniref:WGS project CAEQ00000000 data, annotated contig 1850 n=1 Tax=Trypanosoma congolense (strain IL3000) TaxID=1068625 RepID=F9W9D3_TRYCI|nr:unnamed protein product [Trypanosoma congolense IL3000]
MVKFSAPASRNAVKKSLSNSSDAAVGKGSKGALASTVTAGTRKEERRGKKASASGRRKLMRGPSLTVAMKDDGNPTARPSVTTKGVVNSNLRGKRSALAQRRRAALRVVAREQSKARLTGAENRLSAVREELALFDQVTQVPSFVANPFAAISEHLDSTMEFLKPQTPSVGRAKPAS